MQGNPESRKSFARGIGNFGLWNLEFNSWNLELNPEIRNPAAFGIRNPSTIEKESGIVSGVQNPQRGIQDRRLSWFTWGEMSITLGSLSNDVSERRKSAGSGLFSFLDDGFAKIFSQIDLVRVKKPKNTNLYRQGILEEKGLTSG